MMVKYDVATEKVFDDYLTASVVCGIDENFEQCYDLAIEVMLTPVEDFCGVSSSLS